MQNFESSSVSNRTEKCVLQTCSGQNCFLAIYRRTKIASIFFLVITIYAALTVPVLTYVIFRLRRMGAMLLILQNVHSAQGMLLSLPQPTTTTVAPTLTVQFTYPPLFLLTL